MAEKGFCLFLLILDHFSWFVLLNNFSDAKIFESVYKKLQKEFLLVIHKVANRTYLNGMTSGLDLRVGLSVYRIFHKIRYWHLGVNS